MATGRPPRTLEPEPPETGLPASQVRASDRKGTGPLVQMAASKQFTAGHVAAFDANGNLVDGGAGGPGGGAEWGGITGNIATQADLQTALGAKLDDSQLDTDGTLAANSDAKIPSQKAVKTYVDGHSAGTPSGTVAALDGSGATGASADYSRGDHKHADAARHTHANQAVLNAITAAYTTGEAAKVAAIRHAFCATLTPDSPTFYFPVTPFGGTITGWRIVTTTGAAVTGTIKVWKKASDVPAAADSINTSGVSIAAAKDINSTTLTDFTTTTISIGDRVAIHLESGTDPVTFSLEYE